MKFNRVKMVRCLGIIGACALVGCVNASVSEPSACDSQSVSFPLAQSLTVLTSQLPSQVQALAPQGLTELCSASPSQLAQLQAAGLPSSYQLAPQTTSTSFDFSSDLNKIDSVAKNLNVQITQLLLDNPNNQFGFISSVEVDIQGADPTKFPEVGLATYTVPSGGASSELSIQTVMPSDVLLSYLKAGQVTLTINLHSNPVGLSEVCSLIHQNSLTTTAHMCVAVSGDFSKSL